MRQDKMEPPISSPVRDSSSLPDPSPVIELIESFRRSKAMFAAVSLGIFDLLERGPGDLATLAVELRVKLNHWKDSGCLRGPQTLAAERNVV